MTHHDTSYLRRWKHLDQAERIAAIITRRDAGMSKREIGISLDVGSASLSNFCLRHNISGLDSIKPTGGWYDLTTEEKVARVEELRGQHKVTSQVAQELGITTNTLIGFMWRNKVRGVSERVVLMRPPPEAFVEADPVSPEVWLPLGEPVGLVDNVNGCAWPVDTPEGQRCCGAPKARGRTGSYCEAHYRMAYRPTKRVEERSVEYLASLDSSGPARPAPKYVPTPSKRPVWRGDDE